MKHCPDCGRTFTNNTLINCLNDGTPLVEDTPVAPSFGASAAPPVLETPPGATVTTNYSGTPLSAIPELQSPEIQAALKEALDKAGMSSLLGDGLQAKSTISVTTRTTTSQGETPFFSAGTLPPAFTAAMTPPTVTAAVTPRRKRSPWSALVLFSLIFLAVSGILWYMGHKAQTENTRVRPAERTP